MFSLEEGSHNSTAISVSKKKKKPKPNQTKSIYFFY